MVSRIKLEQYAICAWFECTNLHHRILEPSDLEYNDYTKPKNLLITTKPYFVLLPSSITPKSDILSSIDFIRNHNLLLTICSTGHSITGRSFGSNIYNYSFQINFNQNKKISIVNDTNLRVESGATFKQIYPFINNTKSLNDYVIVGGTGKTVGMSGYTLGGGESPLSVKYGLAIDSVVQFELITADKQIINVNNNEYNDLFWALKGGGGGTFGIVTNITTKLHKYEEDKITNLLLIYPYFINNTGSIFFVKSDFDIVD